MRYNATAQALHWDTAAVMFVATPFAWLAMNTPETLASHKMLPTLHKSVGQTILVVAALRLTWRVSHPSSPYAGFAQ